MYVISWVSFVVTSLLDVLKGYRRTSRRQEIRVDRGGDEARFDDREVKRVSQVSNRYKHCIQKGIQAFKKKTILQTASAVV